MRSATSIVLVMLLLAAVGCTPGGGKASGDTAETTSTAAPEPPAGPVLGPEPPTAAELDGDGIKVGTFLGDVHRRYYGRGPVPGRLDLIWKARIGSGQTGGPGGTLVTWSGTGWTGQPTLVRENGKDYLLIGGYDHNLRKIDAATGETVWTYKYPDVVKGTNTVFAPPGAEDDPASYIVVVGSRRGVGVSMGNPQIAPLRAVSFASGEEIWRHPVPRTRSYSQDADSSPLLHNGRLYAAVESGYVYALEPTATVEWNGNRRPEVIVRSPELYTSQDAARHGGNLVLESSPAILGNTLYIAAGSGHVYGLDLDDLSIVWDFFIGSDLDGTISVTGDGYLLVPVEKQYIPGPGGVFKLDPRKPPAEAVVWYHPTDNRGLGEWLGGVLGSVAINDAYDTDWSRPPLAAFHSVDGYLYVISQDTVDGVATGPNNESGLPRPVLVSRHHIGGGISTPIIVDDAIVSAGYDGTVRVFSIEYTPVGAVASTEETDAAAGAADPDGVLLKGRDGSWYTVRVSETASFGGGGSYESTPIVWDGRVYIGSRDGNLYCLGVAD